MSASGSAKSRMERILRLHAQIDEIKDDIREVYAEEKADGGDKTAMGAAVTYIRKREKDRDALADREAMVGVYLAAFDAPRAHTHAREAKARIEIIDSETGEIHDTQDQPETATVSGATNEVRDEGYAASAAGNLAGFVSTPAASVSDAIARTDPPSTGVIPSAGCTAPSESAADEISDPAQTSSPEPSTAGEGFLPSSPAINSDEEVVPAFMKDKPGCLKLRDGHCKISFATQALCSECNFKRAQVPA